MSQPVISVENVSKYYRLGLIGGGTLHADLDRWWAKAWGRPDPLLKIGQEEQANRQGGVLWALRNLTFQVRQGEALGIIGRNGAGKSTLLKILSQVTDPTAGQVKVKGRVASLLEVGTGFHPELTGRENIYLNGAILGMKKAEIAQRFDEIVAFAEIERYLDTPVKRYSSGMYVRLAFAVAAHLEPEILLVDEVLAVGDAAFQKKCLGRMGDVAQAGRTVLFVSHNMVAVQTLCQRALWLDAGELKTGGQVGPVVSAYLRSSLAGDDAGERVWPVAASAPGNETVRLHRIAVLPEDGRPGDLITMRTPVCMEVEYWNLRANVPLYAHLQVQNDQGIIVFTASAGFDPHPELHAKPPAGLFRTACHVPGSLLNSGFHRVDLSFVRAGEDLRWRLEGALGFEVVEDTERKYGWYGREPGVVLPRLRWETVLLDGRC